MQRGAETDRPGSERLLDKLGHLSSTPRSRLRGVLENMEVTFSRLR